MRQAASGTSQLDSEAPVIKGIGERIDAKEIRMRRLEAALDSVLRRLDQR